MLRKTGDGFETAVSAVGIELKGSMGRFLTLLSR
jgi:hypothetical protein